MIVIDGTVLRDLFIKWLQSQIFQVNRLIVMSGIWFLRVHVHVNVNHEIRISGFVFVLTFFPPTYLYFTQCWSEILMMFQVSSWQFGLHSNSNANKFLLFKWYFTLHVNKWKLYPWHHDYITFMLYM